MYLKEKPVGSVRCLRRVSGTFLFKSLRIWERGLLMPEVGTDSSSSTPIFAVSCCSLVLLFCLRGDEEEEEKGLADERALCK